MRKLYFPAKSFAVVATVMVVCILLFFSGYLYKQNCAYKSENRKLLILNDSIMSVNIELTNQLKLKDRSAENLSVKFKITP